MKTLLPLLLCSIGLETFAQLPVAVIAPVTPPLPSCREGLPLQKHSEKSIYSLEATWTSDGLKDIKLATLGGRPVVMALFFTSCEHSCPLIVKDMKGIQKGLTANVRDKVEFLLVSIDPERDTPEKLRAFRDKYELPMDHWTLLRGKAQDVKTLADAVGYHYYPGSNSQFAHTLSITILNPAGEIVFQLPGVGHREDAAIDTILRLLAPGRRP